MRKTFCFSVLFLALYRIDILNTNNEKGDLRAMMGLQYLPTFYPKIY